MVLLVDIGNSNIVFGFACEKTDEIGKIYRLKSFTDKTCDEYYILFKNLIGDKSFDNVIISSVVPVITSAIKKMFEIYFDIKPLVMGPGLKTGIQVKADDPRSVGADLLCDVAGALKYAEECLVIDLGTATKYLYCKNNTFLGVSIAPGVAISMKALVNNAALLPSIELHTPKKVLCNNTINCMQSGVIYGAASQVDGMIDRIKEEIGNNDIKIIATGGLSKLIVPLCRHNLEYNENLNLIGLLQIYKKNI